MPRRNLLLINKKIENERKEKSVIAVYTPDPINHAITSTIETLSYLLTEISREAECNYNTIQSQKKEVVQAPKRQKHNK